MVVLFGVMSFPFLHDHKQPSYKCKRWFAMLVAGGTRVQVIQCFEIVGGHLAFTNAFN